MHRRVFSIGGRLRRRYRIIPARHQAYINYIPISTVGYLVHDYSTLILFLGSLHCMYVEEQMQKINGMRKQIK